VINSKKKTLLRLLFLSYLPFLAFTPAQALDPNRHISQFGHSTWRIGGSSASVPFTIAQSTDGYMWFGTASGLVRFDGVRFILRPSEINLLSSKIFSLAAARDGSLWVGTDNGLAHWVHQKLIWYADVTGWVQAILEDLLDREGALWIGTAGQGLYRTAYDFGSAMMERESTQRF
jgi:ligand-binding sensor domain-containing protein